MKDHMNTVSGIFKEQLRLKRTMNFIIVFWDLGLWTSEASFILEILKENVNDFQAVLVNACVCCLIITNLPNNVK